MQGNRLEEECKKMAWQAAKMKGKRITKGKGKKKEGWVEGK